MRSGTPPVASPAPQPTKPGTDAPPPPPPPRASIDLESPYAVEASEATLGHLALLVKGLAEGSLLLPQSAEGGGAGPSPLVAPTVAAALRIAHASLRRGVASGISLAQAGLAKPPTPESSAAGQGGQRASSEPSSSLVDLASAVQSVTAWGGHSAGVPLSQIPVAGEPPASAAGVTKPASVAALLVRAFRDVGCGGSQPPPHRHTPGIFGCPGCCVDAARVPPPRWDDRAAPAQGGRRRWSPGARAHLAVGRSRAHA